MSYTIKREVVNNPRGGYDFRIYDGDAHIATVHDLPSLGDGSYIRTDAHTLARSISIIPNGLELARQVVAWGDSEGLVEDRDSLRKLSAIVDKARAELSALKVRASKADALREALERIITLDNRPTYQVDISEYRRVVAEIASIARKALTARAALKHETSTPEKTE